MKKYITILFLIGFISCARDRLIIYKFNDVSVTRIDKDSETFFYYGDFSDRKNLPENYIRATYSGFNYVMSSYMIFKKDKTVTFVDMGDGMEKTGNANFMNIFDFQNNLDFIHWQESFKSKFDSIVRIHDVIDIEQKINIENNSKVIGDYSKM